MKLSPLGLNSLFLAPLCAVDAAGASVCMRATCSAHNAESQEGQRVAVTQMRRRDHQLFTARRTIPFFHKICNLFDSIFNTINQIVNIILHLTNIIHLIDNSYYATDIYFFFAKSASESGLLFLRDTPFFRSLSFFHISLNPTTKMCVSTVGTFELLVKNETPQ